MRQFACTGYGAAMTTASPGGGSLSSPALELRARRRAAALTQRQLAELATVSERSIRALEKDALQQPRLATLHAIAVALGLDGNDREAFVGQWRPDETRRSLPPHSDYAHITERLLGIPRANSANVLSVHDEWRVLDGGSRVLTTQRRVLRATSSPSSYYWTARRRRPGETGLTVLGVVGGRLRTHATDGDIDAFLIDLSEPAAKGRPVLVGLEHEIRREPAAGPPDRYTLIFADVPDSVSIVGRFEGLAPAGARTLLGRTSARAPARGRRLPLGENGSVSVALTRPTHPLVGIVLDWPPPG